MPFKLFVFFVFLLLFNPLIGAKSPFPLLISTDFKDNNHLTKTALKKLSFENSLGFFSIEDSLFGIKIGAADSKGNIVIPARYQSISVEGNTKVLKKPDATFDFYVLGKGLVDVENCDTFRIEGSKIIYRSDFKWGAYIPTQKSFERIIPKYKEISVEDNIINTFSFPEWKFISSEGGSVCCVYADSIILKNIVSLFSRGGKYGFLDVVKGKELTPAIFDNFEYINNLIIAKQDNYFGLVNITGKVLIPFALDSLIPLSENLYKGFIEGEGWQLYSSSNNYKSFKKYEAIGKVGDEFVTVKMKDGLWSYVNEADSLIFNKSFTMVKTFNQGFAEVKQDTSKMVIDTHGNVIADSANYLLFTSGIFYRDSLNNIAFPSLKVNYDSIAYIERGRALVKLKNKYGVIDSLGKEIIPLEFTSIVPSFNERVFLIYKEGKFGIIDFDGIVLSEPHDRFQKVFEFREGRAKFFKKDKFGFIDKRGNVRIAPQYKEARDFKEGLAAVFLNGKWGFIDKDEEIKVQPLYTEVSDFKNGLAIVRNGKQLHFVRKDGTLISKITYDSIRENGKFNWVLFKNSKVGLADSLGREIVAPRYEEVVDHGDVILVKKYNKWGAVDNKENNLQPIEFDFIDYLDKYKVFVIRYNAKKERLVINEAK